jgi:hypothetical protein
MPGTTSRRGISDLLAYTLMFGIIITGVGLVSLGASGALTDLSEREQVANSERSMAAAAATLDDLHQEGDTRRSFNLPLGGGEVYVNASRINVSSPTDPDLNATYSVGSLEQRFDRSPRDVTVAYEAGAVFRSPGVRNPYRPSFRCDGDVAIVSIARLQAGNFAISEQGGSVVPLSPRSVPTEAPFADLGRTLVFSAETVDVQRTRASFAGGGTVRVNVSGSPNRQQWGGYFERPDSQWTPDPSTDHVWECSGVDTALVRVVTVELETSF